MDDFEKKFEQTIELVKSSGMTSPNKPVIPHALRVGEFLYKKGFSDDVVIAGLLHDVLEWSSVSSEELEKQFGNEVIQLIKANTKDRSIENKIERRKAQIQKCVKIGDDALAIKIADNFDSFTYYTETKNESELDRCREWTHLLSEYMSENLKRIFEQEIQIIKKTA